MTALTWAYLGMGKYKMNVDANGTNNTGIGIGGVVRNDSGRMLGTFSAISPIKDVDVVEVEALAMGVNFFNSLKLPRDLCEMESNSKNLVQAIKDNWCPPNFLESLWKDLSQINCFYSVSFIDGEKNLVASEIAREGNANGPWFTTEWSQLSKCIKGLCMLDKFKVSNLRLH
jgi:hypothetical protein